MENAVHALYHNASVLVVGAGGLGSVLLYCLCGMGVGSVTVVDGDAVAAENLDRQFLYRQVDVGRGKAEIARAALSAFRPDAAVTAVAAYLTEDNADALVAGKTVAVAAVDNMEARRALNAACVRQGVPLVNGGVSGQFGTVQVVYPGETACLGCLYADTVPAAPQPSPPAVVSAVSALMADAAAAVLAGRGRELAGQLFLFDGETLSLSAMPVTRSAACGVCGTERV